MPEHMPPPVTPELPSSSAGPAIDDLEALAATVANPGLSHIQSALDNFNRKAAGAADADNHRAAAAKLFATYRIGETLKEGRYTAGELESVLHSLHAIDSTAGDKPEAWQFLVHASGSEALQELSAHGGTVLDDILADAIQHTNWAHNSVTYKNLVQAAEQATWGRFGNISTWRTQGRVAATNDTIEALAAHGQLPHAYASIASKSIESDSRLNNTEKMIQLRDAETAILEGMLGVPAKLSNDFRFAVEARTLRQEKGAIIPIDQGGGIDHTKWKRTMNDLIDAALDFGVPQLQQLYEKTGIINFGRYEAGQLERMRLLTADRLETDEEREELLTLLDRLRTNDVRVVFLDAFGDHNDALGTVAAPLETENNTTLFFEIHSPGDIYRYFILLRSMGILPASVALGAHGDFGAIGVGKGAKEFAITGERLFDQTGASVPSQLPISESSLGRLFHEFMQPRRDTGEREIILVSCLQASTGDEKAGTSVTPTAEHVAYQSDPRDRVVVYAGETLLNITKTPGGDLIYLQPDPNDPDAEAPTVPLPPTAFRAHKVRARGRRRGMRTGKAVAHREVSYIPRM